MRIVHATWLVALAVLGVALGDGAVLGAPDDDVGAPPLLTPAQLDDLVAPIALYPDIVLDSLLPATTDPLGVVAAARHVQQQGGSATTPPEGVRWDPSVVAMLQFPDVLQWMSDNLTWLESAGYAMSRQSADVLAAVQRYRARAIERGALVSDEHLTVTAEAPPAEAQAPAGTTVVVIAPTRPEIVYVPTYDPWAILATTFVWVPGRSFLTFRLAFAFGSFGPWAWHDIVWTWGTGHYVRICGEPWWWGRPRPAAWYWGPNRPTRWHAPTRLDRPWLARGWRLRTDAGARPGLPAWHWRPQVLTHRVDVLPPTPRPDRVWTRPRESTPPILPTPPRVLTRTTPPPIPATDGAHQTWRVFDRWRPSGPSQPWRLGEGGRVDRQIDRGRKSLAPPVPPKAPAPGRRIRR